MGKHANMVKYHNAKVLHNNNHEQISYISAASIKNFWTLHIATTKE